MWNLNLPKANSGGKVNREAWLDIAKCFCIVMIVISHTNIRIPVVTFLAGMFLIPLFFVSAGYTFRNKRESFKNFVLDKAKRLLIPYFICNILLINKHTTHLSHTR